jgi:hypothetical protein
VPSPFDYVLCADILEHLRDPAKLLREIRAVLNSGNVWFRLNILLGRFPQDDKGLFDRTHLRFYMWSGWQHVFETSGFRIHHVEPSAIPVSLVAPARWSESAAVRLAEDVFYGLARVRKQLFAYQFVVRASAR